MVGDTGSATDAPVQARRTPLIGRGEAWLFSEAPALRLGLLRLLVFGFATLYVLSQARPLLRVARFDHTAFEPIGIVQLLSTPLPASATVVLWALTVGFGTISTVGIAYRYSAPMFALLLLWVTSYRSSWGMVFHTENLFVLHAACLSLVPAAAHAARWTWSARKWTWGDVDTRAAEYGWPLRVLSLITVCTYVVAGIAKLQHAGLAWAGGHEIRTHIAYDAVRKLELGSWHSPLGAWLVQFEFLFVPLALLTLALELGAPLALWGGRAAMLWCAIAWGFHASILLLMLIVFPYPLVGIAYASFFALERPLMPRLARLKRLASTQP